MARVCSPSVALLLLAASLQASAYLHVYPPVNASDDSRTPLFFGLLQSFGGDFNSSGVVAGVEVALDRINNNSTLLPGYSLHYTLTDSQCNRTTALEAFFPQVIEEPLKVAIIGSGCSLATEPTAEVSRFYNLTQISCVSSSPSLSDRFRFSYYFQLLPSEASIAPAYYGVIKFYQWRRVALIVQNENLFTVTMRDLKELLDADGIEYREKIFNTNEGIAGLGDNPFDMESRIYLIETYSVHARPLLCEAYRQGLKYPRHLLLTPAWYENGWWLIDNENLTCTAEQRTSVLPSSLAFVHFDFLEDLNMTTDTGITGEQYLAEEKDHLGVGPLNLTELNYSQYCYDATWTLAYALNDTINEIGGAFQVEDFGYNNDTLLKIMFRNIEETNFTGITGDVAFGENGVRDVNRLRIIQFRPQIGEFTNSTHWVEIGYVKPSEDGESFNFVYLSNETDDTVWPNGLVPYDGVPEVVVAKVSAALAAVFYILAIAGLIFAVVCLVFNFFFRKKKMVRLSSPNLNYLIGAGAIILYVNIGFYIVPTDSPSVVSVLCNITPWLTALGYSLCYGTILAKMCRIYYIFNDPTPNRKTIQDWVLILAVMLLCVVDLIILVIYNIVEGARGNLAAIRVPNRENRMDIVGELGVIFRFDVFICDSQARDIFLGILYGYKAALQIVALVLSFGIRKVKVKGLDDSKYIAAAVYVTSIVLAVVIVAIYSLNDFVNVFPAVLSAGLFIGTTGILALVFIPKMIGIYKDPFGESVFNKTTSGGGAYPGSSQANTNMITDKGTIDGLKKRVRELEDLVNSQKSQNGTLKDGQELSEMAKEPTVNAPAHHRDILEHMADPAKAKGEELQRTHSIWDTPENVRKNGDNSRVHDSSKEENTKV